MLKYTLNLVLAWKFEAEVMCRFTRQEFIQGCKAMNVDSIKVFHFTIFIL